MTIARKFLSAAAACLILSAGALLSCAQSSGSSLPAAPSGLTANAVASTSLKVNLSWTASSGASSYNLYDASTGARLKEGITGSSCIYSDETITQDASCSFCVTAVNSDGESSASDVAKVTFYAGEPVSSDWLILYYADGDNNLSKSVLCKEQEICNGLQDIEDKDVYENVNVVTLFDGSSKSGEAWYGIGGSYLLQLNAGKCIDMTTDAKASTNALQCDDYSDTASWMTDSSGNQEVDMSSKDTLINFLIWAQGRYTAPHTMLIISDHGAGPYAWEDSSRAVCTDNTSAKKGSVIQTTQFPEIFSTAGYNIKNKLDMVFMDCCLESSLEEAYELKDYTEYYTASANTSINLGFTMEPVIQSFKKNVTAEDIGKAIVETDRDSMQKGLFGLDSINGAAAWGNLKNHLSTKGITKLNGETITDEMLSYTYGASECSGTVFVAGTAACINLTDFDTLAKAFDALAGVINKGSADQKQTIIDTYLKISSPVKNALIYPGTVCNLFDVGYFTYQLTQYASSLPAADASWAKEITDAAAEVETDLGSMIVASWRDMYKDSDASSPLPSLYCHGCEDTHVQGEGIFANNWFGLTIAGGLGDHNWWYGNNYGSNADMNDFYPSGYSCHLDFTKDHPAWNTLLQATLKTL
jgi:hypothetical protein